jgi:hypothetical protein
LLRKFKIAPDELSAVGREITRYVISTPAHSEGYLSIDSLPARLRAVGVPDTEIESIVGTLGSRNSSSFEVDISDENLRRLGITDFHHL